MSKTFRHLETALIHAGELDRLIEGAVVLPIFQSSTYEYAGQSNYADLTYIRLNNTPNHQVLHKKLAALEGAEAALVTASGMAAISAALLSVLSAGDHLLAQATLYGGTHGLLTQDFASLGLSYDFIDTDTPSTWEDQLRPTTKAVYVETLTNPLIQIGDLEQVAQFARRHGLVSIIDNTFATPINFRPVEWGFDLVVYSGTKYLNGHSDVVAGTLAGRAELVNAANARLLHLGGTLDPHACFLLHRGLKTMALRMRQHNQNGLAVAELLDSHPSVTRVCYPGLQSSPDFPRACRLLDGFGGMVSFEVDGGVERARRVIDRLELPVNAPSLGGVEALVTRPATTSHSSLSATEREKLGISDGLIRYSTGIEAAEDLIDDLRQALDA